MLITFIMEIVTVRANIIIKEMMRQKRVVPHNMQIQCHAKRKKG